ncbi:hypothetical protein EIP86_006670 [Pleurotus ostreatoroseus]|nr:hypothetical protein EIP86_006670 [Pleurotus ostreatoroseus]
MEDIRFVLEAPQINRPQKKRPRLVTSCDNCRLKKIKCIQTAPDLLCEACSTAHIPCRFRDRERYFAERSRAVTGGALSHSDAKKRSPSNVASQAQAPATGSMHGGVIRSQGSRAQAYHPYLPNKDTSPTPSSESGSDSSSVAPAILIPLFDPMEPDLPNVNLMLTYIQVFCDNLNVYFPFIAYDETLKQFFGKTLTPLMANCIAALAVKFVELPDVLTRGVMYVTDQYIDKAKALLVTVVQVPTVDTLHSLILLAWAEYKRNRFTHFCSYGQLAVQMALELRLNDERVIQLLETEYERNNLRHTWECAAALDAAVKSQPFVF